MKCSHLRRSGENVLTVGVVESDVRIGDVWSMRDVHLDDPDALRAVADHAALAEQWRWPLLDRLER